MNRSILCSVVLGIALSLQSATAAIKDELTAAQLQKIEKGEQVFKTVDVNGSDWPKAYVYEYIDATPEEAMAVMWDVEMQKDYIPSLLKSKISKVINASTIEVDFIVAVPIIADEWYTVRDHVSTYDNDKSYLLEWTLVKARTTKGTEGYAKFETHGKGTLMAYYNFVTPGSALASFARDRAMKQVCATGSAIVKKIETERDTGRTLLNKQIENLKKALAR